MVSIQCLGWEFLFSRVYRCRDEEATPTKKRLFISYLFRRSTTARNVDRIAGFCCDLRTCGDRWKHHLCKGHGWLRYTDQTTTPSSDPMNKKWPTSLGWPFQPFTACRPAPSVRGVPNQWNTRTRILHYLWICIGTPPSHGQEVLIVYSSQVQSLYISPDLKGIRDRHEQQSGHEKNIPKRQSLN